MTLAEMLAKPYAGVPLALWLLGGGVGFYLLMHHQQYGSWEPAPLAGIASAATTGPGPAYARPQIFMPQFEMPTVIQYPQPQGALYG